MSGMQNCCPYQHVPKGRRFSVRDHKVLIFHTPDGTSPTKIWQIFGNDFLKIRVGTVVCCDQHKWCPYFSCSVLGD